MKKLLCMLFLLFPIIVYSQVQNEWQRAAEQQIKEYYQAKLDKNEKALRNAQNELDELSRLPDSEFTAEVKSQGAYLGAKIEALKAERKALKEELDNRLRDLHRQTTAKPVQSQKSRQPEKTARQKQNQSRMAETSKKTEEEAQRKRTEEAARKAKEEQARKAQFDSNKQKAMQTSDPYYNTQRAYVEHTASSQAFAQVSAKVSNNQVQRTLSNVPSGKSGKQMPGNSTFNKLQQRNRGGAVNGVFRSNHQENTALLNRKLDAKKAASNGRYDEKWFLEQKKVALDTWLGSVSEIQKSSSIDEQKESLPKNIASHLMSKKQAAELDKDAVINALSQQDGVAAEQRQYAGMVSDQGYKEPHFLSQLDASAQSWIIDVLVKECKDQRGLVNSDMLKEIVNKVDDAHMKNVKTLEGSDDVTARANKVLAVFRKMCNDGFCKKYPDK